ncbi:YL1 nuclear protein-domain-containing protein [Mycena pura]|uniref:YL1 nuclear protein-domain-containing protein n=1 Tax=Mycena pura TaxID=153505 RepID=A0AAD6VWK0_9AGAR|nr:YL1 nuclear protein-domain-containing protein [Mycena pura]
MLFADVDLPPLEMSSMDIDSDSQVQVPVEELLVTRRLRRSTAGNRMQAAMAEMEFDELKDGEEDADYTNDKDEEDIFDADFESTDSEAAGETAAQEEEMRPRKAIRAHWEKAADAAHVRNKATFDPLASVEASAATSKRSRQRPTAHRQSMRKHTMLNTSLTETRLKRSEEKKAAQGPKKPRPEIRTVSQAELIARALDAEEGNIVQHRDYLKLEEEKRRRARVVRTVVEGPLLRCVSRVEEVQTVVSQSSSSTTYAGGTGSAYAFSAYPQASSVAGGTSVNPLHNVLMGHARPPSASTTNAQTSNTVSNPTFGGLYASYAPTVSVMRTEKVARNYVVHEETRSLGLPPSASGRSANTRAQIVPKPTWGATMSALFGSHVNWEEVQVYVGKNRPLSRPIPICPITGRAARYRDPRTGVPFADVEAFQTITRLLDHEYVWSAEIGAYVRQEAGIAKPAVVN